MIREEDKRSDEKHFIPLITLQPKALYHRARERLRSEPHLANALSLIEDTVGVISVVDVNHNNTDAVGRAGLVGDGETKWHGKANWIIFGGAKTIVAPDHYQTDGVIPVLFSVPIAQPGLSAAQEYPLDKLEQAEAQDIEEFITRVDVASMHAALFKHEKEAFSLKEMQTYHKTQWESSDFR